MRNFRHALLPILLGAAPAAAQAPAGPELRVNTSLAGSQTLPAVAADTAGNFVVVWSNAYPPHAVSGQRFDPLGAPRGAEFLVRASGTGEAAFEPDVASEADGGFTVVWTDYAAMPPPEPARVDVFGRRYDAAGVPRGMSFPVNTYTSGPQSMPAIAADPAGGFVVVWTGRGLTDYYFGIFGQRFDAGGNRMGAEFPVSSTIQGRQVAPAVAVDPSGNFVVVWRSAVSGNPAGISGQRFTREGVRIGSEFQVSATSGANVHYPAVAAVPDGGFMVTWTDSTDIPGSVVARRYEADGHPTGPEFIVHTLTNPGQFVPAIAADDGGRYVIVWNDLEHGPLSDLGVKGRRYDASGAPRGRVFRVNTSTTAHQGNPDVASDAAGNVMVAWTSAHADTTTYDIYAQRYRALTPWALKVDPAAGGGADGNHVLEPGETVGVHPVWHNHTGAALGLSGELTGLTGPPGASYAVVDGMASYGEVPNETPQACLDCYAASVSAPAGRPSLHWDATAAEELNLGAAGRTEWLLHVGDSFGDVPRASAYYRFVETLLHAGVTGGCAPTSYCPASATSREQMAALVLMARENPEYRPPFCSSASPFNDVPPAHPYCRWIAELKRRGVVAGCGGGNYCPTAAVSREQMAVFVLRTLDPALDPPACAPPTLFADVPETSAFCRWIEELARRGVVGGCAPGLYCPAAPVTREQMAVFLTGTFGLTLYGP